MSKHAEIEMFRTLVTARGQTWTSRGYSLVSTDDGYAIEGDFGQFYLDCVAADVEAHLALEFLRRAGSPVWTEVDEMATDDGIDLADGQEVFMLGKSLEEHLSKLR